MSPVDYIVVTDANFVSILAADGPSGTNLIQNFVSLGGFTGYITANLTSPGTSLYIARLNANGSIIVNQSKQPGLTSVLQTYLGWPIPA
jgi:hypothetical protein